MQDKQELQNVEISHGLVTAIHSAEIPFEGRTYRVRVVDVEGDRLIDPIAVNLTVQIADLNRQDRLTLHLGLDRLEDPPFVVSAIVGGMQEVLSGRLPPGVRQLL